MTIDLGSAHGRIVIDTSGVEAGVARANRALGTMRRTAGLMGTAITGAMTSAAVGMGAFAVSGLRAAADLEASMSGIASVLGQTADEVQPLKELIQNLGIDPNLKISSDGAAAAIQMLARNGLDMAEILDGAARSVVLLSNATGGDLALSADIATDAMAQFGFEANQLETVADSIAGVVNNSKLSMDDFGLALAQAGGVAATVGVDFDDFTTSIATISPLFASGSDAGTSFKTFLQRLVPDTEPASEAMRELGLLTQESGNAFFDAQGNMKSMADITGALNGALRDLSDEQRISALTTIFGTDAQRTAAALANTTAAEYENLSEQINENTSAAANAATRVDNLAGDWEILQDTISAAGLTIMDSAVNPLRFLVQAVTDIASRFADFIPTLLLYVDAIRRGHDPLEAVLDLLFEMNVLTPQVETVVRTLFDVFQWLVDNGQTIINVIGAVAVGLAAFQVLSVIAGAVGAVVAAWGAFTAALAGGASVIGVIVALLGGPVTLIIGAVAAAIGLLALAWTQNWGDIQGKTALAWEFIQGLWNSLVNFVQGPLTEAVADFASSWSEKWNSIRTALDNMWQFTLSVFQEVGRWLNDNLGPWVELLAEKFTEKWAEIQDKIESVWGILEPIFITIGAFLAQKLIDDLREGQEAWENTWSSIKRATEPVAEFLSGFFKSVTDFWDRISGSTLDFKINIPDLPDWAIPGSPLPIDTAWRDFARFLDTATFQPDFVLPDVARGASPATPSPVVPDQLISALLQIAQNGRVAPINAVFNNPAQDQRDLIESIRLLEAIRS